MQLLLGFILTLFLIMIFMHAMPIFLIIAGGMAGLVIIDRLLNPTP
jgi:hypothetical protein